MPGRDGTGPRSEGPLTGGGRGNCRGGGGGGGGGGRGFGAGRGGGGGGGRRLRQRGRRFGAGGGGGWQGAAATPVDVAAPQDPGGTTARDLVELEERAKLLESSLDEVRGRIRELTDKPSIES